MNVKFNVEHWILNIDLKTSNALKFQCSIYTRHLPVPCQDEHILRLRVPIDLWYDLIVAAVERPRHRRSLRRWSSGFLMGSLILSLSISFQDPAEFLSIFHKAG